MERFEVKSVAGGYNVPFSVAMGEIFGGYCIVGPPEAVTHVEDVFAALLSTFQALRHGYQADPENYNPRIVLVTPADHPDLDDWLVQRLEVNTGFDMVPAKWSDQGEDVYNALAEAEALLRGVQEG